MITTFSIHYRRKYGSPVGKIPLDVGVECPNRRRGGCIFCRPAGFTPLYLNRDDAISTQLAKGKKDLARRKFRLFLGYFQQETVTALPMEQLRPIMKQVLGEDACVGLILSTRPDYIDAQIVASLDELGLSSGKEILVELGLQSVHDKSLRLLNRNHTYNDYRRAAELIGQAPHLQLGVHLIFGIPGESSEEMLASVKRVCAGGVDALKFHHLQVVRDTELHRMYQEGEVKVLGVTEYMRLLVRILALVPREVVIHRLWSTCHPDILIAPKWDLQAFELNELLRSHLAQRVTA